MSKQGSVIIPAHNEASVIERTLAALLRSVGDRDVEIVVVANGCSDDTAERARQFSDRVTVVESEIGSKILALNLGDEHATAFPRLYLDGDIEVSETLVGDLFEALAGSEPLAAWPNVKYDTSHSSIIVSAFYYVWTRLPYNRPGRIGVGIYGMNEAGRSKFGIFPKIISDDGFVRGQFGPAERRIVNSCHTTVQAPVTTTDLIKIRTRSRLGVYELRSHDQQALQRHRAGDRLSNTLLTILRPDILLRFPVYVILNIIIRLRARRQLRNLKNYKWERDESTRSSQPIPEAN